MDPNLLQHFEVDQLQALLRVARRISPDIAIQLNSDQYDCLSRHRVVPLLPIAWCGTPRHHADLLALRSLEGRLQREVKAVVGALQPIEDNVRVLKGMATRYLDYERPSLRHSGDLDLLVPEESYEIAIRLLEEAGYSRLPLRQREQEFGKGTTLLSPAEDVEVDLHRRLVRNRTSGSHTLFEGAVQIDDLGALAPPGIIRLIHAATHLLLTVPSSRRLSGVADIAALTEPDPDLESVRSVAEHIGLERETCAGLAIGLACVGEEPLDPAAWGRLDWLSESAYLRSERFGALDLLVRSRIVDGPLERVRFLIEVATADRRLRDDRSWADHARLALRRR